MVLPAPAADGWSGQVEGAPRRRAYSLTYRKRSALVTTDTEIIAIAAPAKIGDNSTPKKKSSTPVV